MYNIMDPKTGEAFFLFQAKCYGIFHVRNNKSWKKVYWDKYMGVWNKCRIINLLILLCFREKKKKKSWG